MYDIYTLLLYGIKNKLDDKKGLFNFKLRI